jgi:hypothetical protein
MEKIAFIIYLVAILVSPLLFGGVHTYAYTFSFLLILVASLLLLRVNLTRGEMDSRLPGNDKAGNVGLFQFRWLDTGLNPLFIAFFLYMILQMIPLPDFLLARLSTDAKVAGDMSLPAASVLDPAALKGNWYALAPYIYPVRMSLVRWIVYGLLFFGLVQTLNSRKRIELAVILILALGCFESLYGIIQTYSRYEHIWWLKKASYIGSVTGTYINRNHFAGLMEMGIVLAIAYAGALSEKSETMRPTTRRKSAFTKFITTYLSAEKLFTKRFLIIFAGVVMGLGLILSASRGGIISIVAALLAMGLFFVFRKDHRRKGAIVLVFFAMTSIYALYVGIDYTVGRFMLFDQDFESRASLAKRTMLMFDDYTLAGVGIGNFMYAFTRYQTEELKYFFVDYAHNDWAQFMADAGTAGLILLLSGIAYYTFITLKAWVGRRDPFAVCLGIAPIVVMTAIGIHSYVDFNLHRPANFMMLVAVTAIGYSALHLERNHRREKMTFRFHSWPLSGRGAVAFAVVLFMILWSGAWTVRHFVAEAWCFTEFNPTLKLDPYPPAEDIGRAISWDPGNAGYRYKLARELMNLRDKETRVQNRDMVLWHEQKQAIIATLEEAIRLNPLRAEYHERLSWEYSYQYDQPDYRQTWLPAADMSMERASYYAGTGADNPRIHADMGNYWTMRSRSIDASEPNHEAAWMKAVWHYKKVLELEKNKKLVEEITGYVKSFYPDEEHLKEILYNE